MLEVSKLISMSDTLVPADYMRARFDRLETKLDRLLDVAEDTRTRVSTLERSHAIMSSRLSLIEEQMAGLSTRFDRLDRRFERVEVRLGLIDPASVAPDSQAQILTPPFKGS